MYCLKYRSGCSMRITAGQPLIFISATTERPAYIGLRWIPATVTINIAPIASRDDGNCFWRKDDRTLIRRRLSRAKKHDNATKYREPSDEHDEFHLRSTKHCIRF